MSKSDQEKINKILKFGKSLVGAKYNSSWKTYKIDESVGKSHFYQYNGSTNTGHYTHVCLPQNWLLKK